MRAALVVSIALILSSVAYAQVTNTSEQVVKRMFDKGAFEGQDSMVIGQLGDEGAVLVTKILAGRDLTPKDIEMSLVVIARSFNDPSFVKIPADREPRTTMLVLRYLEVSTSDPALRKRVADATRYVQDRYASYTASLGKKSRQ